MHHYRKGYTEGHSVCVFVSVGVRGYVCLECVRVHMCMCASIGLPPHKDFKASK